MKLCKALKEQGIVAGKEQALVGSHDLDCPKPYCKENRLLLGFEDKNCLTLEVVTGTYAKWKCRHCYWSGHVGDNPEEGEPQPEPVAEMPKDTGTGELPPEIWEYFDALKISREVVTKAKVRWRPEQSSIGFPYLEGSHTDKASNMMLLRIPEQTSRLASSKRITLYGADTIPLGSDLVIVQGEIEKLIFDTCGIDNTVAIPNSGELPHSDAFAAFDAFEYLANNSELLRLSSRVVIALDSTPQGNKLRQEVVRRVGAAKCFTVKFTRGTAKKTYRELGSDVICADVRDASAYPIRGLYEVMDFKTSLLAYFNYGMASGVSTGFENVDQLLTIAPGRLTLVTGVPNSGKSEFVDAVNVNLTERFGYRHAVFSPENGKEIHTVKLVEKRVMQPADPRSTYRMSEETFLSAMEWVQQHFYYIFSDIMDEPPTLDWILDRARDAVLRYGVNTLTIDPWNRIQKTMGTKSETEYVAEALSKILRFATAHNVHVWLVAHPSKQEPDRKTGKLPEPSLYSVSGSAHFVNMCDNGVVIHRRPGADKFVTEVHVKKVRFKHEGEPGTAYLVYNMETGRYAPRIEGAAQYSFDPTWKPSFDGEGAKEKVWEAK